MPIEAPYKPKSQTTAQEPTGQNESDSGAPSNSPENIHFRTFTQNTPLPDLPGIHKVSWDRMTIVGNLDPNRAQSLITEFCNEPNVRFRPDRSSRAFTVDIMDAVYCNYNLDGPSKDIRNFRLEFNPNNAPEEFLPYYQAHILPCLTDVGFSRLDLAIDTTEDLGTYHMDTVNPTGTVEYRGRGRQLETLYFGSRKGTNYIRIYDKKNQLQAKDKQEIPEPDLWRIEFEMKGPQVASTWTACADKLLIHKIEFPQATKGTDIIICLALEEHPTYFEYLNSRQRTKYRKMMNQTEGTDLMPGVHQAIKQSEQRLQAELEQWMPGWNDQTE